MTAFSGVVWAEDDSLSLEKIRTMVEDDNYLKTLGDKAPAGLIEWDSGVNVPVWGGGATTIWNKTVWLPYSNRMVKWTFDFGNIWWGTNTTNVVKFSFWIDGSQVFESWTDNVTTDTMVYQLVETICFVIPALAEGNHTFQIKMDYSNVSVGTTINFQTTIADCGESITSQ